MTYATRVHVSNNSFIPFQHVLRGARLRDETNISFKNYIFKWKSYSVYNWPNSFKIKEAQLSQSNAHYAVAPGHTGGAGRGKGPYLCIYIYIYIKNKIIHIKKTAPIYFFYIRKGCEICFCARRATTLLVWTWSWDHQGSSFSADLTCQNKPKETPTTSS